MNAGDAHHSPADATGPGVTVTIIDGAVSVRDPAPYLPADWNVRRLPDPRAASGADIVVLGGATGAAVGAVGRWFPNAAIVAVIDEMAPAEAVVDVLGAGATACVRTGPAAILAGHLRACQRRRTPVGSSGQLPATV